jgi:syntaxin-binding protein 1
MDSSNDDGYTPQINIRETVKKFFSKKVIDACKTNENFSWKAESFMLVVDDYTMNLMNSFVPYPDLIDSGIIGVERLDLAKKQFPGMHAIYFVSPTIQSVDEMARDFPPVRKITNREDNSIAPKDRLDGPTYSYVHIVFNNHCPPEVFAHLKTKKDLLPFIVNLSKVYLDFRCIDDSFITLDSPGLLRTLYGGLDPTGKKAAIEMISSRVTTFVSTRTAWRHIKIVYNQSPSGPAQAIAKKVQANLERIQGEGRTYGITETNPIV